MEVVGMIVAAGRGSRAGGKLPKQYEACKRTRMLSITITALLKSMKLDAIIVVINPLDINLYIDSTKDISDNRLLPYCYGGPERSESVKLGLEAIEKYNPKKVLIHDAARPYITTETISRVLESLKTNIAVLPVLPIFDAIWKKTKSEHGPLEVFPGPDRADLLLAQTPQGFHYHTIFSAYKDSNLKALDDISIAYEAGIPISTVAGDESNYKITSAAQLKEFKGKF